MGGKKTFLLLLWVVVFVVAGAEAASVAKPNCSEKCGNISVPYPFGFGNPNCYKDSTFKLDCNDTNDPPELSLGNIPILNIDLQLGLVTAKIYAAYDCYNESGLADRFEQSISLASPFTFSNTLNKFIATGCDTWAFIDRNNYGGGCISMCSHSDIDSYNSSWSGLGFCKTSIPKGLKTINITVESTDNHRGILDVNPCSYAFLAEEDWFNFSNNYLSVNPDEYLDTQVVLDWVIGEKNCEGAPTSTCGPNSNCINSTNSPGYRCSCNQGYQGNPYLPQRCQDIDECLDPTKYSCKGNCKNTQGNYTCSCPFGKHGDGKVACRLHPLIKVFCVIGIGILMATVVLCLCWVLKQKIREKYFRENGGMLLKKHRVKIFKEVELRKATNNYDSKYLLGEGGNGSVYKGLVGKMEVAIKKSKVVDKNQIEQFLNEIEIVSQINHKNVVKLVGLCLDDKVPLLVYEFISNGTLFQHIHNAKSMILNAWKIRLQIAAEIAGALDYMHSTADPPIIHRDVKTSNILVDSQGTGKIADFGASKLIPFDRTIAPTQGQGTMGYIDPEYLQTGELTVKSDVYSFGVVLMELLTRERPISNTRIGECRGIVMFFISSIQKNHLDQIVNVGDVDEHEMKQIYIVGKLAEKCVAMPSTKRPTMKKVADVLNGLMKEYWNSQAEGNYEETKNLLEEEHLMKSFSIYSDSTSSI